jgi:hypothetical protein
MRAHKDSRRTNLIWAVRDPHMLEFFLKHGEFSSKGWNLVFYTGKEKLYFGDAHNIVTATGAVVHVIKARPDLDKLIPNVSQARMYSTVVYRLTLLPLSPIHANLPHSLFTASSRVISCLKRTPPNPSSTQWMIWRKRFWSLTRS